MNISEDKFENKSANQIVQDVLLKHQNNTQDALNYIQNISSNDGLSLSKETIDELKKAEDILNRKIKRESLIEAWWPFKKKQEKTYKVTLTCYPPFKKEPTILTVNDVKSLDDPRIEDTYKMLRNIHPYSLIYLDSELGRKKFYPNSLRDYKVNAYDKNGNKTESFAGNLPIAMGLSEKLYESDNYDKIDILKDNKVISTYKGLNEGWLLEDTNDGITKKQNKLNQKKSKEIQKINRKNNILQTVAKNDLVQDLGTVGLSGITGIHPSLLKDVTKSITDYAFNTHDINSEYRKEKAALKRENDFSLEDNIITEDSEKPSGYKASSFVNLDKDIADLNERKLLCACDIHPEMKSNRYRWKPDHQLDADYVVLDGIKVENDKSSDNGNKVKILLKQRIPVEREVIKDGKLKTVTVYVDGDKSYEVNLNYFKAMINSKANKETKEKFDKKYPESSRYMEIYDDLAKAGMEKLYLEWISDHFDTYKLDRFDELEKYNIYVACKKADHELTPDEIDSMFFFPKLAKQLENQGTENIQTYITSIKNTLRKISNENDKNDLRMKLGQLSDNILNLENDKEIENELKTFVSEMLPNTNANLKLDNLTNGKVSNFEKRFLNDKNIDDKEKEDYLNKKNKILDKFIVDINGINMPVFNQKIYQYLTKSKKNLSDPKKEIEDLISQLNNLYYNNQEDYDYSTETEIDINKIGNLTDNEVEAKLEDLGYTDKDYHEYLDHYGLRSPEQMGSFVNVDSSNDSDDDKKKISNKSSSNLMNDLYANKPFTKRDYLEEILRSAKYNKKRLEKQDADELEKQQKELNNKNKEKKPTTITDKLAKYILQ